VPPKPEVQQLLDRLAELGGPPLREQTVDAARQGLRALSALRGEDLPLGSVTDITIPGPDGTIAARVYVPTGEAAARPGLIWLHGGGWTIGDLDTTDSIARSMCGRAEVVVVSLDYRLAPEHPHPAGLEDCLAAVRWVHAHGESLGIDTARLAIGGDSAGGNLAAVASQELRGEVPLRFQLLVYPATDLTLSHGSIEENAEGYLLTKASMMWFTDNYLQGHDAKDPRASPLYGDLEGLPPALVVTAEYDPLRDEGEAYAAALRDAGVHAQDVRYEGQIHQFFSFAGLWPDATVANERAAAALRAALS
jgi:acetyl esterase